MLFFLNLYGRHLKLLGPTLAILTHVTFSFSIIFSVLIGLGYMAPDKVLVLRFDVSATFDIINHGLRILSIPYIWQAAGLCIYLTFAYVELLFVD